MTGPTGLIFAMRARFASMDVMMKHSEMKLIQVLSNDDAAGDLTSSAMTGSNPATLNDNPSARYILITNWYEYGIQGEALGDAAANSFAEMAFSIENNSNSCYSCSKSRVHNGTCTRP